ncbi:Uncharacterized protein FWK35_00006895 [Aphis craccivora]|uniref:Uncharacterized protein n=1 Tax=Aphis craccivora TaxID=307492 RepID=A0A6G0YE09_APHCR|nr:Uncharacterized protein FWK35_00006895 [Aphis craccivora]
MYIKICIHTKANLAKTFTGDWKNDNFAFNIISLNFMLPMLDMSKSLKLSLMLTGPVPWSIPNAEQNIKYKYVPFTKCGMAFFRAFFIHSFNFGSLLLHCTKSFAKIKIKIFEKYGVVQKRQFYIVPNFVILSAHTKNNFRDLREIVYSSLRIKKLSIIYLYSSMVAFNCIDFDLKTLKQYTPQLRGLNVTYKLTLSLRLNVNKQRGTVKNILIKFFNHLLKYNIYLLLDYILVFRQEFRNDNNQLLFHTRELHIREICNCILCNYNLKKYRKTYDYIHIVRLCLAKSKEISERSTRGLCLTQCRLHIDQLRALRPFYWIHKGIVPSTFLPLSSILLPLIYKATQNIDYRKAADIVRIISLIVLNFLSIIEHQSKLVSVYYILNYLLMNFRNVSVFKSLISRLNYIIRLNFISCFRKLSFAKNGIIDSPELLSLIFFRVPQRPS